ncbi:unnamed protein product [Caretta caretta]
MVAAGRPRGVDAPPSLFLFRSRCLPGWCPACAAGVRLHGLRGGLVQVKDVFPFWTRMPTGSRRTWSKNVNTNLQTSEPETASPSAAFSAVPI